jgi:hypothetical protein
MASIGLGMPSFVPRLQHDWRPGNAARGAAGIPTGLLLRIRPDVRALRPTASRTSDVQTYRTALGMGGIHDRVTAEFSLRASIGE